MAGISGFAMVDEVKSVSILIIYCAVVMSANNVKPLIPFPALLIDDGYEKVLVVGDLHIGWEISLVDRGIYIPSQVSRLQLKLLQIIDHAKPSQIVFLGDVKQAIPRISLEEWRSVPEFFETVQDAVKKIFIILGNHDGDLEPLIPSAVKIIPSSGMVVGEEKHVGLFHGHAWPSPEVLSAGLLVMGHIHPVVWFRDKLGLWTVRQVWIKAKCDREKLSRTYLKHQNVKADKKSTETLRREVGIETGDVNLIVMPAFNELLGGMSINRLERGLMGPILHSRGVDMDNAEAYLLDGTYIGTVKQLRAQII